MAGHFIELQEVPKSDNRVNIMNILFFYHIKPRIDKILSDEFIHSLSKSSVSFNSFLCHQINVILSF